MITPAAEIWEALCNFRKNLTIRASCIRLDQFLLSRSFKMTDFYSFLLYFWPVLLGFVVFCLAMAGIAFIPQNQHIRHSAITSLTYQKLYQDADYERRVLLASKAAWPATATGDFAQCINRDLHTVEGLVTEEEFRERILMHYLTQIRTGVGSQPVGVLPFFPDPATDYLTKSSQP